MKAVDTVILGTVATEHGVSPESCVAIADGKVVGLLAAEHAPEAAERIEYPGCVILPGVIDAHVHCQHSSKGTPGEGFTRTSTAAAAGGVTTFMEHPMDIDGAVLSVDYLAAKRSAGEAQSLLDFVLWGAVDPHSIAQIEPLARAGVGAFKMFMSECRYMDSMDDGSLLAALQEIGRVGTVAAVHAENLDIITSLVKKFRSEGRCGPEMHLASRPDVAELEAVMRVVEFAKCAGADLHICHVSLARAVDYVYRQRLDHPHLTLTTETCPQYLLVSDEVLQTRGAYAKIDPPLRKAGEQEAMWEQVRLGRVALIGSDHGPHKPSVKSAPVIFDNNSGSPGVETMATLIFSEGVMKGRLPLEQMVTLLSGGPARRFGIYPRKGALLPGSDGDLTVIDPGVEWEIRAADLHQTSGWTNYEGMKVRGKPIMTMVRGRAVYREGEILGSPGYGRFVPSSRRLKVD